MANSQVSGYLPTRRGRGPESEPGTGSAIISGYCDGQSIADVLQSRFRGAPWIKVTDESRTKLDGLGFCDYWRVRFAKIATGEYFGADAGMAQDILDMAIKQERPELDTTVAETIGEAYGNYVLSAEIEGLPNVVSIPESNLGELARVLLSERKRLEELSSASTPDVRAISDSWINLTNDLVLEDQIKHGAILNELQEAVNHALTEVYLVKEAEEENFPGGSIISEEWEVTSAIAKALARNFPDVVIGKLREPRRHNYTFDGLPITWFSSAREKQNWATFAGEGLMSQDEARENLRGLLSLEFLNQTLTAIDPEQEVSFTGLQAQLLQMGKKCNVFLVNGTIDSGRAYPFVVMQAKGERLSSEIEDDYENLQEVDSVLESRGITPFVPKPYTLGKFEGVSAFSVEYLFNHDEVTPLVYPIILPNGLPYTVLIGNSGSDAVNMYNNHLRNLYRQLAGSNSSVRRVDFDEDIRLSPFYSKAEALKVEIIARLYVVQRLLGKLPREFLLGAGDFMANFDSQVTGNDPRLITIRGGWQEVANNNFADWIKEREDTGIVEGRLERGKVFVFTDPLTISRGIEKGEEILSAKASIS